MPPRVSRRATSRRPPPPAPAAARIVTWLAAAAAFLAGASAAGWFASRGPGRWFVDRPNERSLHERPVSRAGGIAILAGTAAGLAVAAYAQAPAPAAGSGSGWLLVGALLVVCVSFADDVRRISSSIRIVAHLAAAGCVVLSGGVCERIVLPGAVLHLGPAAGAAFTVLFVAWFVNLYNFMDGMDGLAGGMAVIGFTTFALFGALQGAAELVATSLVVASAALGFLLFNFPPAKLFMGDLGSTLLGYLSAVTMLRADHSASVPLWISLLAFSPFFVDASVTLVRRTLAGERPWRPHHSHFYQRLVRLGWGHRKTVVREYGLMIGCACSAVAALRLSPGAQAGLLAVWTALYVILVFWVGRFERGAGA